MAWSPVESGTERALSMQIVRSHRHRLMSEA